MNVFLLKPPPQGVRLVKMRIFKYDAANCIKSRGSVVESRRPICNRRIRQSHKD